MRGCLLCLILVVLIAANGYYIWQVHEMRALVGEIHADMVQARDRERSSMIEHARNAMEAVGRGEIERAQAELKRLSELIEQTRIMARRQRESLRGRLAEAREALDRGSARASELVEDLVRDLSRRDEREPPEEPAEP